MRAFSRYSGREVLMFFIFVILFLCEAYAATGGQNAGVEPYFIYETPSKRAEASERALLQQLPQIIVAAPTFEGKVSAIRSFIGKHEAALNVTEQYVRAQIDFLKGGRINSWPSDPISKLIALNSRPSHFYALSKEAGSGVSPFFEGKESSVFWHTPGLIFDGMIAFPRGLSLACDKAALIKDLEGSGASSTPESFLSQFCCVGDLDYDSIAELLPYFCERAVGSARYAKVAKSVILGMIELAASGGRDFEKFRNRCHQSLQYLRDGDEVKDNLQSLIGMTYKNNSFIVAYGYGVFAENRKDAWKSARDAIDQMSVSCKLSPDQVGDLARRICELYVLIRNASGRTFFGVEDLELDGLFARLSRSGAPFIPGLKAIASMKEGLKSLGDQAINSLKAYEFAKDIAEQGQVSLRSQMLEGGAVDYRSEQFFSQAQGEFPNFDAAYREWRAKGFPHESSVSSVSAQASRHRSVRSSHDSSREGLVSLSQVVNPDRPAPRQSHVADSEHHSLKRQGRFVNPGRPDLARRYARDAETEDEDFVSLSGLKGSLVDSARSTSRKLRTPSLPQPQPQPQAYDGHGGVVGTILSREERKAKRRGQ